MNKAVRSLGRDTGDEFKLLLLLGREDTTVQVRPEDIQIYIKAFGSRMKMFTVQGRCPTHPPLACVYLALQK